MIPLNHYDTKATKEVHLVRCYQSHPNDFLSPTAEVGNRGEAYFGAESGEEYMLVDKEAINC